MRTTLRIAALVLVHTGMSLLIDGALLGAWAGFHFLMEGLS
jgi:hypothetical protein